MVLIPAIFIVNCQPGPRRASNFGKHLPYGNRSLHLPADSGYQDCLVLDMCCSSVLSLACPVLLLDNIFVEGGKQCKGLEVQLKAGKQIS